MIAEATIDGRPAIVAYLNDALEPVDEDEATVVEVQFTDDKDPSFMFLKRQEP